MTTTPKPRPIDALDVPLPDVERQIAKERFAKRMAPLAELLAHPETAAPSKPATDGERAEVGHLKRDADGDSVTRPFVDLSKGITWSVL